MRILYKSLTCIAALTFCYAAIAQQRSEQLTVAFSDPSRPGILRVAVMTGSITIKGSDRKDVAIEARPRQGVIQRDGANAPAGLRRLAQSPSFTVEEQNNRMAVGSTDINKAFDFEIQVPARTHLNLSSVNGGDILIEGVEGELEVGNVNGSITLNQVGGSVVAHTVNGNVLATLTRITPQKPMALTTLNGAVDVTLPPTTPANLKLRSDRGEIFTDFDLHILPQASVPKVEDSRQSGGRYRVDVNKVLQGSINGGGADIEMRTFNGDIYVRKGNLGSQIKPSAPK